MKIETNELAIEIELDGDGYPLIAIQTNGLVSDCNRPAVELRLNGVLLHDMFDSEDEETYDNRWEEQG